MDVNNNLFIEYFIPLMGFLVTLVAQIYVKNSYNKYRYQDTTKKITGAETARMILDKHGMKDVKINKVSGELSDHYNPSDKTVNLSPDIYEGTSIASVSVAAHECGHAIQHNEKYRFLTFRSLLFPIVNFSTKIGYLAVMIGLIFSLFDLAVIGLILLLTMLLFQLVTLPVEFNASSRAKKELVALSIVNEQELSDSKTMLTAAALTYVASVLSTLLQILRLALIVFNRRDD